MQSLSPAHLETFYNDILDKGLSMRQAEYAHATLRLVLEAVVKKGLLPVNPADKVPNPPRTQSRAEDRPRLAKKDVGRVLREVEGTRYYIPFLLAMSAGLRRGEIVGLRWRDVDLERGIIHVRHQIQLNKEGRPELTLPKMEASIRDIPIPSDVVAALRRHKAEQKVVTLDGFVCTNRRGGHLRLWDLSVEWARIRCKLGLPKDMTFHDLRGSWVTWLAEAKVDVKAASMLLGHADVKTTLAIYQSVTEEMKQDVARAMDGITRATSNE